jgi:F-box protein 11
MAAAHGPSAFISYAPLDDVHDDGLLTVLRERLSAEVSIQTGQKFPIFQDHHDISWGENWRRRIEEEIDAAAILLVIVTPQLFRSTAARDEVARFQVRERVLQRSDLIMPVYYIRTREIDEPARWEHDEMAALLASRQYADWRELRFERSTSPLVRKAIAQLATQIRTTVFAPESRSLPSAPERSEAVRGSRPLEAERETTSRPSLKVEPPTLIVDPYQRGDFTTIGAAIAAAHSGDRIVIRPGQYEESLVVNKPLEILGDGPADDVLVVARGATALEFQATIGRVANLTLRQGGGEGQWYGADITNGRLDLESCIISSQSLACVVIRSGADPRLRRNRIRSGNGAGVLVQDYALGTLEDNEISRNRLSGVEIRAGGNPVLRNNRIFENKESGVLVHRDGEGTVDDNEITGNGTGIAIGVGGNPVVRRNRISSSKHSGIFVYDGGQGDIEDNDIIANGLSGIEIENGGDPTVRENRINGNEYWAVWVRRGGRGTIEGNDLTANYGAWRFDESSQRLVSRERNRE